MTEMHTQIVGIDTVFSEIKFPNARGAQSNTSSSPVLAALTRNNRRRFKPARLARDAARIEEWAAVVKSPRENAAEWEDTAWLLSYALRPYGLDLAVNVSTSIVPRGRVSGWGSPTE